MENRFAEATINVNNPVFSYNTWTSKSNKNAPDNANKILSSSLRNEIKEFAFNA